MIELLVAILIALGSLTSHDQYTEDFARTNQAEVSKAQNILDTGAYHIDERTGGVIVHDGVGL